MEEGGETLTFEGTRENNSHLKVILRVRKPQFYWKVRLSQRLHFFMLLIIIIISNCK